MCFISLAPALRQYCLAVLSVISAWFVRSSLAVYEHVSALEPTSLKYSWEIVKFGALFWGRHTSPAIYQTRGVRACKFLTLQIGTEGECSLGVQEEIAEHSQGSEHDEIKDKNEILSL